MLLTNVQVSILELLKTYRCLRNDQICRIIGREFQSESAFIVRHLERLQTLCRYKLCQPRPGFTGVVGAVPDDDLLLAVDVMLEFQACGLGTFRPGKPPFKLIFFKIGEKGHLRAYYVTIVHSGTENLLSSLARNTAKGCGNAVIFVLDNIQQARHIQFPFEHFYVVRENDGYQFYKGGDGN